MHHMRHTALLLATLALVVQPAIFSFAAEAEWPQFRGPGGEGHATATNLPASFGENENIVWKCELPGKGWSSPVIAGQEIWMTTAVEKPLSEEEKAKRLAGTTNNQPLNVAGELSLRALCVDRRSGKLVHNVQLLVVKNPQPTHSMNSFASPTPVIEDGKLYCHFGAYGTACLDTATQQVVWTNRETVINHENGPGSSPVVVGDLVIFHCDGSDVQYIAALDKRTGKIAWRTDRSGEMNAEAQLKKSYGTPLLVEIAGRENLVSPAADWLYGYDPVSGRELWKVPYEKLGFSISPRPVVGHGMIFMSTSFMQAELIAFKYDKPGNPEIAWRFGRQAPSIPSPLLVGDEVYIVSDKGIATCLDAHKGTVHWTERLPGNYAASPLFADGKIYFCNREGLTTTIAPSASFQQVGSGQLPGQILASPAAVAQALYIRTDQALYRIEYLKP
jgi:outer membrane protein assembly factor BamB